MIVLCDHELAARSAAVREQGGHPLAILDMDLTLLDNAPRTRAIWRSFCHAMRYRWPQAEEAMLRAQTMPIVFGVQENLVALGVPAGELAEEGLRFWIRHFFGDRYCRLDEPLPGDLAAVKALMAAGLSIVYLSARPQKMIEGTVARLRELDFPIGVPGTVLVMKDETREGDSAYKERALEFIGRLGQPLLAADNEPGHVNAMKVAFPEADCLLVETRHSAGAPPLRADCRRVASVLEGVT